jgi:hypothetical protein
MGEGGSPVKGALSFAAPGSAIGVAAISARV